MSGKRCYGIRLTYADGKTVLLWRTVGRPEFGKSERAAVDAAKELFAQGGVVKAEVMLRRLVVTTVKTLTHGDE